MKTINAVRGESGMTTADDRVQVFVDVVKDVLFPKSL